MRIAECALPFFCYLSTVYLRFGLLIHSVTFFLRYSNQSQLNLDLKLDKTKTINHISTSHTINPATTTTKRKETQTKNDIFQCKTQVSLNIK